MPLDALCQYPCAYLNICAGIGQPAPSLRPQGLVPTGIDLHDAVIVCPVGVPVNSAWVEGRFLFSDGPQEHRCDAISISSFLEAKSGGICCQYPSKCHRHNKCENAGFMRQRRHWAHQAHRVSSPSACSSPHSTYEKASRIARRIPVPSSRHGRSLWLLVRNLSMSICPLCQCK